MGCQNSKVRSASTTEEAFKPVVAKDALATRTFSLPPASPISSPARSRRQSDADSVAAAAATAVTATVPTVASEEPRPVEEKKDEAEVVEPAAAMSEVQTEAKQESNEESTEAVNDALAMDSVEEEEDHPKTQTAAVAVDGEVSANACEVAAPEEQEQRQEEEVEEKKEVAVDAEKETEPAAPVVTVTVAAEEEKEQQAPVPTVTASAMGERPKSSVNVRRVAFDKETMRRTAPRSAPAVPAAGTRLTKKQQQMYQTGHKSAGRRGPVASKHSRCKAQMQEDVYLAMANAFERLLTNVNTIDAHLDSR